MSKDRSSRGHHVSGLQPRTLMSWIKTLLPPTKSAFLICIGTHSLLCPPWSFQSYQRSEPCPSVGVFLTPSFPFPCSRPPHCTLQSEIQEWVEVYFPQLHWKLEMEGSAEWCSPRWWLPQSPKGSSSGVWGRCLTPVRHPWVASAWSPRSLSHRDWDRGQASPRHCLGQNQSYSEDGVGRQPGVES